MSRILTCTWAPTALSGMHLGSGERRPARLAALMGPDLQQALLGPVRRAEALGIDYLLVAQRWWGIHVRNQQAHAAFTDPDFVAAVAMIEAECAALLRQRLRLGQSYSLQTRFLVHRKGLWTFLHDPAVPPTNNSSAQALRPLVIHRKVTNGFRATAAAEGYAALGTVAETARRRGESVFATLLQAAGTPLPLTL